MLDTLELNVTRVPSGFNKNTSIEICNGAKYSVTPPTADYQIIDTNHYGYDLTQKGVYYYHIIYKNYCRFQDTVNISVKECVNPHNIISIKNNTKVQFTEKDVIKIFNKYDQLILTLNGPIEWDGRDQYGEPLVPGVYFAIYENLGYSVAITIIH